VWNSTFVGNDAATSGGGLYSTPGSVVQLFECRFDGSPTLWPAQSVFWLSEEPC